jgi:hypothetical protein
MASQVQRMGYIALFGKIRLKKLPTPRTMPPSMHEQERGQAGILFRLLRDNFETCHSSTGSVDAFDAFRSFSLAFFINARRNLLGGFSA